MYFAPLILWTASRTKMCGFLRSSEVYSKSPQDISHKGLPFFRKSGQQKTSMYPTRDQHTGTRLLSWICRGLKKITQPGITTWITIRSFLKKNVSHKNLCNGFLDRLIDWLTDRLIVTVFATRTRERIDIERTGADLWNQSSFWKTSTKTIHTPFMDCNLEKPDKNKRSDAFSK